MEEAEEKKKRDKKAKALKTLANQIVVNVEEFQRLEGVARPSSLQAVVP